MEKKGKVEEEDRDEISEWPRQGQKDHKKAILYMYSILLTYFRNSHSLYLCIASSRFSHGETSGLQLQDFAHWLYRELVIIVRKTDKLIDMI